MVIMVDKAFVVDNLVPCKVYRPAFLSNKQQMSRESVRQTQSIACLRVHVERCIRRVKENKLFDKDIPLSICGNIDELFSVAHFLVNYQNGLLLKAWATQQLIKDLSCNLKKHSLCHCHNYISFRFLLTWNENEKALEITWEYVEFNEEILSNTYSMIQYQQST